MTATGCGSSWTLGPIRQGEMIKFVVTNKGQGPARVLDRRHRLAAGARQAHGQEPGDAARGRPERRMLQPGETKELIWKFSKPIQGDIVFACQMPGHYDAGMVHKAKLEKGKKAKTS